ncbi:MerR family transcriptional regulator [Cellulophaga sp. HaHa_2_95]|uniref:MerR family transcriptional regulator n=1 Tax=Cellulophaga sp. HaHa_2_95 TaxID=2745558 RepID=UPI001C50255F|nr:MerR family transcriptional regulator [Cellulophaga sp. HaHa_2_95]QXP55743.1 MerR family transcriptional regulator [Cellulophaga sp. HaHa_2_95]
MNNVKKYFSIRDLENLSGIKAHTIRIWEKRYNLLEPERTTTNIRNYSLKSLQKLLNITLLYNNGHKISKIAQIPETDIPNFVQEVIEKKTVKNHAINSFKIAMVNFDSNLFYNTYNSLLKEHSFKEVFYDAFIPLLNELGLLWQNNAVSPSHEHFITNLIKQKIILNTEKLLVDKPTRTDKTFVLFLPDNEIHDIGLLYLNYEITLRGYKTIYLGQTVPIECLKDLLSYCDNIYFLSYFTVEPNKGKLRKYLENFNQELGIENNYKFWILGHQVQHIQADILPENMNKFKSIEKLVSAL